jgi:hypothetical protein
MIGLVGLALMLALTFLYFNDIGWPLLAGAWLIILAVPLLVLIGVSGWIVLLIQGAVIGGLYFKAQSG